MEEALSGIRVLDLTNVLSGPFATLQLALLGADVIKIENPQDGDLARGLGSLPEFNERLMGTSFLAQNVNKKSVTLNLKTEQGRAIFRRMTESADVIVENFRPHVMQQWGLGYENVASWNDRIIYCAISGFGQTGPDASKPAYDQIIQGLSGIMAINGTPETSPMRSGFPVCDTAAGLNAAYAIVVALFHRERTGVGQFIDVALLDSVFPLLGWVAANLLIGGVLPALMGNDNVTSAPSGTFRTGDGHINISASKEEQWLALCDVLGLEGLKTDEKFLSRELRKRNRQRLNRLVEGALVTNTTRWWVEALNEKGVPSGEILSLDEALHQPQMEHRGALQEVLVEGIGPIVAFNPTAKYSRTPGGITSPPPRLSADTEAVLGELGFSRADLSELREAGII